MLVQMGKARNEKCDLAMTFSFSHPLAQRECDLVFLANDAALQKKATKRHPAPQSQSSVTVSSSLSAISEAKLGEIVGLPPRPPEDMPQFAVVLRRETTYVSGRYMKLSRTISQSPWFINGQRLGSTSVDECITTDLLSVFGAKSHKFSSSGREDMNVRMLGRGRPFLVQLIDAKISPSTFTQEQYKLIQNKLNQNEHVKVVDLQFVDRESTKVILEGETSKKKHYRCLVKLSPSLQDPSQLEKLNSLEAIVIKQKTPIRVLHRRTLLTRERTIHSIKCHYINKDYIYVDLVTQAGTYVKEFVHSDLGRTVPSLSSLMSWGDYECDILLLDVTEIDLDYPPQKTPLDEVKFEVPSMGQELNITSL
uniref:tRNA pseudouridine(55) synthase n=1 Tax=Arcella intermedia TaxID=1963864 RepID=A0A6B2L465_9EUKA